MGTATEVSPVYLAAFARDGHRLARLLRVQAHAARVNELHKGFAPLHVAVLRNSQSAAVLRVLLAAPGIDVNLPAEMPRNGRRALHLAQHNVGLVKLLLDARGVDVNATDELGVAPIHMAALHDGKCMELLLLERQRRGIDILARTASGMMPVHKAACNPDPDSAALRALLRCPEVDVNAPSNTRTPLHLAVQHGQVHNVRVLLDASGCAVDAVDSNQMTALHFAALYPDDPEVLRVLLAHPVTGTLINARDHKGRTALYIAARQGRIAHVRVLLQARGCDVCLPTVAGHTPLHAAATATAGGGTCSINVSHLAVLQELLAHPAVQVNARNSQGWTPLHVACTRANSARPALVRALIRHPRTDLDVRDIAGRSPMQYLSDRDFQLLWATKVCAACKREQQEEEEAKLLMCACGLCYYCNTACQRRSPRAGLDVDVYSKEDGVQWVSAAAFKGASFLQMYEALSHASVASGPCFVTAAPLSPGFAMQRTCPLYWPPPRRGLHRKQQAEPKEVGQHYALVPLEDIPLADYTAELERLRAGMTPCQAIAAATATEFDVLEPSHVLTFWVATALRALSEAAHEPASVRVAAWVHYINLCALDMHFDELLCLPWVAAWALSAMELYEEPVGDVIAQSMCWHAEQELRKALQRCTVERRLGKTT